MDLEPGAKTEEVVAEDVSEAEKVVAELVRGPSALVALAPSEKLPQNFVSDPVHRFLAEAEDWSQHR
jgi:hypothetical protein